MRGRKTRWALTAAVVGVLAFMAVGGPATAKHFIDGGDIKPGTVDGTQLADGAVSSSKLTRRLRRSLAGRSGRAGTAGRNGANGGSGPAGPQGPAGARGPAGAFNVVDAQNRTIGQFVGWFSTGYPMAMNAQGALLTYDPSLTISYPIPLSTGPLYYKAASCTGTAYAVYSGSLPFQTAIILDSPPSAGSQIYVLTPATPESFSAVSYRTSSGCTNSSTSVSQAFPATSAGTVPAVQKPLSIAPAG